MSAAAAERPVERERRATFIELFFDLVFVFALTRVTALAAAELPEPEEGAAPPGAYTCC